MKCSYCVIMRLVLILFLVVASGAGSSGANDLSQLRDAGPGTFADANTTLTAAAAALEGREESDETDAGPAAALEGHEESDETDDEREDDRNRLFPKMPKCESFDLRCSILVFSVALGCFLVAVACTLCYAMHNKRQQRQKLVPCDAYCTCPAHANHSSHFATRLESA